jgi:hypothetical protein
MSDLFGQNGYSRAELERYFADGARWFAIERAGRAVAACFVFRNFGRRVGLFEFLRIEHLRLGPRGRV